MIEDKELDLIKTKRLNKQMPINFENKNAAVQPTELIQKGVDAAILHKLESDQKVKEQFLGTADKIVQTNLSAIENKAEADEKVAILQNNKDACDLYGIDEETVPKWVVSCARRVQDFWYAIWLIVGFFTTVPIVFLGKKIKVVIKKTWISMLFAILIYIAVITSPLWYKYIPR